MITYPRQGHSFDEPRLYMDFIQRHLDWFDRWLAPGATRATADA
jgi:dipeptidyl aminopeptidase/acylaminoacyl peptidase